MRFKHREETGWKDDHPEDVLAWLFKYDGEEAVAIDDSTKTFYVSRPDIADTYRTAWAKEGKKGDKRTAELFEALARQLHETESMPDWRDSPIYCKISDKLCSEKGSCVKETCE